jgi:basic membrane protein A and related proteins
MQEQDKCTGKRESEEMGKSRFTMALMGVSTLIVLLLSACGSTSTTTTTTTGPKFQVGLVTDIGGLNDRGFNQLAHTGYEKAEAQYHFKDSIIQTTSENDYIKNLTQAAQTNDLVIGVGFLMAQAIDQVAKTYPSKKFALVDSCAAKDANGDCDTAINNVTPLLFKEQQAGCLAGVVAGQMEKDGKTAAPKLLGANTIGAIGGISIPPVDHYIAGYKYCATQVDPNVKVLVSYSNDFTDTTKCQAPADAMIKQKQADIIFQVAGGCGIGALDAAETDGVYGIGVDTDQGYLHPDSIITSATKHVDTGVYTIIDLMEKGQYPSDPNNFPRFDLTNDGVGVAPLGSAVPSDVQPVLNQYISQIKAGTLNIPDSCAPAATCATS